MTRAHIPLPSPRHHLLSAHRESSFEAEFLNRTNCEIWAYDASVDEMGDQVITPHPRVHFNKVYIGPRGSATLGSLMKQNGHHWIDFLKMDIESAEFDVMEQIVNEFEVLPWTQLQIEIHVDNAGQMFPKVYKMWERFEDKGLRAFKSETNHAICVWGEKPNMYRVLIH